MPTRPIMATHQDIFTVTPRATTEAQEVLTPTPKANEILLHNEWTASTPFDLHQNDGHLLVTPPEILGSSFAGTVISTGPDATCLKVGDKVFRCTRIKGSCACLSTSWHFFQTDSNCKKLSPWPTIFVTVFHTCTTNLGLGLPWPKPEGWSPNNLDGTPIGKKAIVIWGGS